MKLATFTVGKETLVGAVDGNELVVIDVPDMRTLFELGHPVTGPAQQRMTKRRFKLADVRLRAPIIPKKIFHTAGNYAEHGEEGKKANWVAEIHPWIMFFQNPDAIIGPDDPVIYPEHLTKELDYELEFCMVIGKASKHLSVEEAGRRHRRLPHLQRHHRARHPAARDAVEELRLQQVDRQLLPLRPVDRHRRRDPRSLQARPAADRQRREAPDLQHQPAAGHAAAARQPSSRRPATPPATS